MKSSFDYNYEMGSPNGESRDKVWPTFVPDGWTTEDEAEREAEEARDELEDYKYPAILDVKHQSALDRVLAIILKKDTK